MKYAVLGYGKMGINIVDIISQNTNNEIVIADSEADIEQKKSEIIDCDVAIEFSTPATAVNNLLFCFNYQLPVVCGTTGWFSHLNQIISKAKKSNASFIYGSNFSIGANLFFDINQKIAQMMNNQPQYIPSVTEVHHTDKLDKPSGTAITLAQTIVDEISRYTGFSPDNTDDTIKINSIREEDVTGYHSVQYDSVQDNIAIEHKAKNRSGFAIGAIKAANWLYANGGVHNFKNIYTLL